MDTKVTTNLNFCGSKTAAKVAKEIFALPTKSVTTATMRKIASNIPTPAQAALKILELPTTSVTTEEMQKAVNYLA